MEYGNIEGQGTITPLPSDFSISGQVQGDILYFNGTNWVRLAPGTTGQRLETNGAAANPSWETDPAIPLPTDLNITGQANGNIIYFNGTNWVRLASGTAGQLLQANGAAAPTWVTPASGSGFVLEQNATFSNSNQVIETVTITTNKNYKMIWEFRVTVGGAADLGFEFNASTALAYGWNLKRYHTITSGGGTGHNDPDSVTTEWTSETANSKFKPFGDQPPTTNEEARISMEFMTHTGLNAMLKGWAHKGPSAANNLFEFFGIGPTLSTSIRLTQAIGGPFRTFTGEYWLWSME